MSKKILIAEDEAFIASLYKLNLEKQGVEVTIVGNGKLALDSIKKERFDMLLLDLMMPEMDGFEVLEYLKKNNIHIPTIVLTHLSQNVDQKKCMDLGAKDYIIKADVDAPDVWEKMKKYLS